MTRQAVTMLLPGTTILLAAATGLSFAVYATPADRWLDPRWYVHALAAAAAFLFYLVLGAIGAAWSRHAGGSRGERLVAGVFPLVLHMAVVGFAVGGDVLYAFSRGAVGRHLDIHFINIINMLMVMLVVPGTALLLGVLPFARRSAGPDAQ